MRQAYDYWQNQPGNYLKPESRSSEADPPKGASFTKQGDAEAPQAATLSRLKAIIACAADSIAPTEFPKSWSATRHGRRCRRNPFPLHTALRRRKPTPRHAVSGYSAGLSPKIWWIVGIASNPQTPNGARQKLAGLRFQPRAQVQNQRILLPTPVAWSRRGLVSAT